VTVSSPPLPDAPRVREPSDTTDAETLRRERDYYWSKLVAVAEAMETNEPLKVVHDVRNVLHEVALLRKLVELESE
jgi:hypothetical protein